MSPRRVYVMAFTVDAHLEAQLPLARDLTSGIFGGLPKEWFSEDDGEPYWLVNATTVGDVYLEDLDP